MQLLGITWDHPRGYEGLQVATEKYLKQNPDVKIVWEKHSLRHFEAHPVPNLAAKYDLIILDHPFMGDVFRSQCLLGLSSYKQELALSDLASNHVGLSLDSYSYGGELWALPIDAASQAAVYRKDLLSEASIPSTLDEVRDLASHHKLALALHGVHAFLIFAALCAILGDPPNTEPEDTGPFVLEETGLQALEILRELAGFCPLEALNWNAIDCLNAMRERNDLVYGPYVFAYSSYSKQTLKFARLTFTRIPGVRDAKVQGAVLGGTGLAISKRCQTVTEALAFARYLTSFEAQLLIGLHNGQPARKDVWLNEELNGEYDDFYKNILTTIEGAYIRPRYAGYMALQNGGGKIIEAYLQNHISERTVLAKINDIFRQSFQLAQYHGENI